MTFSVCTFRKSVEKIQFSLKSARIMSALREDQCNFHYVSLGSSYSKQTQVVEKIKQNIVCSITCFLQSTMCEVMWKKICRAGQVTHDNFMHAHCMVDTWRYKHILRRCNYYCFSTAIMVARTRLGPSL
jgi:hypothetical protein